MEIEQNIFFDEFKNKLISLENSLINIKNGNYTKEDINEVFRAIHTIKGTADLLGMFDVVALSHKAEDLLEYIRNGKIEFDAELCKLYIELKEFISLVVTNVSQGIFDDTSVEKLFIEFEKEFNYHINAAENAVYEYVEVKTILVVEDSALIRYMIKKIGTDEGYNVLTSNDPIDGWEKVQGNAIDLLFCDFSCPREEALELANNIRTDYNKKDLPIVMLLNNDDNEYKSIGRKILAKAWLRKPIDESQLKLILKKLLATK
ncbi:response regulator [Arcobacteraceae bacterium]|nr:response regulator [Arcobacteraceae bacterium]